MSLRDRLALHAPVDYQMAIGVWGGNPDLNSDNTRLAFFAVWAMLRYEYADAMLAEKRSWKMKKKPVKIVWCIKCEVVETDLKPKPSGYALPDGWYSGRLGIICADCRKKDEW